MLLGNTWCCYGTCLTFISEVPVDLNFAEGQIVGVLDNLDARPEHAATVDRVDRVADSVDYRSAVHVTHIDLGRSGLDPGSGDRGFWMI